MKKILSLLAVCMIFVGLASCGDDDDLKPPPNPGTGKDRTRPSLTPEERAAQLRDMQGVYKGWAYFKYNDNISRYKDSAMVSATVTSNDSLMVIKNLPLRIITNRLDRSYAQHLDSTAVIPDIEATVRIYLPAGYTADRANMYEHWFWFLPRGKNYQMTFPVTYDGQERNMTLTFAPNYSSFASNGAFLIRRMLFNVIISSVSLEGVFNNQAINEILEPRLIRQ